jgi:type I restriction enzyme M protein
MDGALVTREVPVYQITEADLDPDFLSTLLRSRYYQRAFRAITTGHSNRRRTQVEDFEALEIIYPASRDHQRELVTRIVAARTAQRDKAQELIRELRQFSDLIDGRGDEEAPDEFDETPEPLTEE